MSPSSPSEAEARELEPRPFCAALRDDAKPVADSHSGPYLAEADVIYCGGCGIMFVGTAEQWNTRATLPPQDRSGEARVKAAWSLAARFWSRVDVRSDSECWPWRGSLSNGYPTTRIEGKTRRAARVAWELANGEPFPAGLIGLHHCDNPPCCNPAHVYPGTPAENMRDMSNRRRSPNQQKTHCPQGHEYTPKNTRLRVRVRGGAPRRSCRACQVVHVRNHRLKTRALKEMSDGQ